MTAQSSIVLSFNKAQSELVTQTADLPLGTLAEMVNAGNIDLAPGFQRRERWSPEKQSALIESFLLNVPVPPIYLAEEEDGTYTAIDGKQRLRAISDYISGRFALRDLERLRDAEGMRFSQLPREITNALTLRPFLRVVTLLKQTDQLLKYEVFLRLNRGGESLNNQEIRNVAFRGPLNDIIYELSGNKFLRSQLKITGDKSSAFAEMTDAEYVLRFLTLSERAFSFSGNLSGEMDEFMRRHIRAGPNRLSTYTQSFEDSISRCQNLWGVRAFRRPEGNTWRDQTLAGMYDAQMIAVSLISKNKYLSIVNKKDVVLRATKKLFSDLEFEKSVRTGTNTPARIKYRIEKMTEALESVDAHHVN